MSLLASPLSSLLDRIESDLPDGLADPDPLRGSCEQALAFTREGRALFERVSEALLRTPSVEGILEECRRDLRDQEASLQEIVEGLDPWQPVRIQRGAEQLRLAAESLAVGYGRLREQEAREPSWSPFPVLDQLIKSGINLIEGRIPLKGWSGRLGPAVALVQRMERDLARFEALHGLGDLKEPAGACLGALQSGLGAAVHFLETGAQASLADSLKLLGRGSAALSEIFKALAARRPNSDPSRPVWLVDLLLAHRLEASGGLGEGLLASAWLEAEEGLTLYRDELEAFRGVPLHPFLTDPWRIAWEAWEAAWRAFQMARAGQEPAWIEAPLALLRQRFAELRDRFEEELRRFEEAPNLEDCRERVGRVLQGGGGRRELIERIGHARGLIAELAQEAAAGGLVAPLAEEMVGLLEAQEAAYARITECLLDRDLEALRSAWSELEQTFPAFLALARGLRGGQTGGGGEGHGARACLRCGQGAAAAERLCAACGAVLPAPQTGPTEYHDITAEPASGPTTLSPLERLEGLLDGLERDTASLGEVQDAWQKLWDHTTSTQRALTSQFAGLAGPDPEAQGWVDGAQGCLSNLLEGLEDILSSLEAGQARGPWRGIEICRQATRELLELQEQLGRRARGG